MITWRLIARYLRRHPGRSTLTLLSIAIGIASVIAVSLATATTRQAYRRMYEEIAGRAALQVTAPANATFPQEVAEKIARVPGVQAAVPSYQRATRIVFEHKWLVLIAIGIDPAHDSDAREYELREGRFLTPDDSDSGLLEAGFAAGAGIHVGDRVKFLSAKVHKPGHLGTVTIVGLLAPRGPAGFNKGGALFVPLKFAQRYLGDAGEDQHHRHRAGRRRRRKPGRPADPRGPAAGAGRPSARLGHATGQGHHDGSPVGLVAGQRVRRRPGIHHHRQHVPHERQRAAAADRHPAGRGSDPPADRRA